MRVAIDASNIRAGGGITHLVECLAALQVQDCEVSEVTIFAGSDTLTRLEDRPWLRKVQPDSFNSGAKSRFWWRHFQLDKEIISSADILLVPGGSYLGHFRPFVAMAQNLLPFDSIEQRREGWSFKRLRLMLLEKIQGSTFRRSEGVIYMSSISKEQIERRTGFIPPRSRVVHHGTGSRFFRSDKLRLGPDVISAARPFRLLYVSIIDPYKHQNIVVSAVAMARARGVSVTLDLVGPASADEARRIRKHIVDSGATPNSICYHGPVQYERLEEIYSMADAFVFASSCETFGIILLEAMAGGLPLLCSNRSAMPEVVGDAALFFDPLDVVSLVEGITKLHTDLDLQRSLSFRAQQRAARFSWEACAAQTFGFLREVYDDSKFSLNT